MRFCRSIYSCMTHFIYFQIALLKLHNKPSSSLSLFYSVQQTVADLSFDFFLKKPTCADVDVGIGFDITKTRLFKYTEKFTTKKWKFSDKNSDIFLISAQNIDCGYPLEPPRRGGSNEYPQSTFLNRNKTNNVYPCKPQFYCIKLGFKGVNFI